MAKREGNVWPEIRVRRAPRRLPWRRHYEIEVGTTTSPTDALVLGRREAVRYLERLIGVGDASSLLAAADAAHDAGESGWAVDYDETANPP